MEAVVSTQSTGRLRFVMSVPCFSDLTIDCEKILRYKPDGFSIHTTTNSPSGNGSSGINAEYGTRCGKKMWSVFNPPRHSGQLKSQSLVQFRGFMASSALAKKKKGPKNSVVVKPKKLKLPEQEYQEKTRPLVWAQNFSRDQYELPPVSYKKGKWFVKEGDTERVFAELPELDTSDLTRVTNVVYRKRFSKLVRKFGFLHRVFPTFMPDFFPRINLVVDYPGDNQVFWGNLLDTEDVQVKPTVKFLQPIGRNRVWTLLLVGYGVWMEVYGWVKGVRLGPNL
eukprot:TRINITY_DN7644_c0_g2_i3.p1 TRINITY_DN7644_c0_g2~~TRINITY_DN7644_c0_g2_i3.p1  ORF type:complete len:281 (+),score=51.12 TRINITY_DN7644_c0_g2_i3:141-983(+)